MSEISNKSSTLTDKVDYTTLWNTSIPVSEPNSLWYSGLCQSQIVNTHQDYVVPACNNRCTGPLGLLSYLTGSNAPEIVDGSTKIPTTAQNWTFSWTAPNTPESPDRESVISGYFSDRPGYLSDDMATINVRYCLARTEEPICSIGLIDSILLVTICCLIIKTVLCIIVVWRLSDNPLVTIGDAIESFIVRADPTTLDSCARNGRNGSLVPRPNQWKSQQRRMASGVPKAAWFRTYLLFVFLFIMVGVLMVVALVTEVFSE